MKWPNFNQLTSFSYFQYFESINHALIIFIIWMKDCPKYKHINQNKRQQRILFLKPDTANFHISSDLNEINSFCLWSERKMGCGYRKFANWLTLSQIQNVVSFDGVHRMVQCVEIFLKLNEKKKEKKKLKGNRSEQGFSLSQLFLPSMNVCVMSHEPLFPLFVLSHPTMSRDTVEWTTTTTTTSTLKQLGKILLWRGHKTDMNEKEVA